MPVKVAAPLCAAIAVCDTLRRGGSPPKKPAKEANHDKNCARRSRARHDDIENLLGFLLSHAPYADHIDRSRIAIAGHSLGGYTALGMAGAPLSTFTPGVLITPPVSGPSPGGAQDTDLDGLQQEINKLEAVMSNMNLKIGPLLGMQPGASPNGVADLVQQALNTFHTLNMPRRS